MTDPIADMLTRIRNAYKARFEKVDIPCSRLKISIANALKNEGYIKNYKVITEGPRSILRFLLNMKNGFDVTLR